jgi:hypothetical protein
MAKGKLSRTQKKTQEQRLKEGFKSNFQIRNKTRLRDLKIWNGKEKLVKYCVK